MLRISECDNNTNAINSRIPVWAWVLVQHLFSFDERKHLQVIENMKKYCSLNRQYKIGAALVA
jgi:hypothetical protein